MSEVLSPDDPPIPPPRLPSPNAAAFPSYHSHADGKPGILRLEIPHTRTPVVGCDIAPYVVIKTPDGDIKAADSIEAKTRGSLSVQGRWNRLVPAFTCAFPGCAKPATLQFAPAARLTRAADPNADPTADPSTWFCSAAHLRAAWATTLRDGQNRLFNEAKATGGLQYLSPATPQARDAARDIIRNVAEALPPIDNPRSRIEVGYLRKYTPTKDDIAHALEVSVRYVWHDPADSSPNPTLGPPMALETEPVITMPPPPPKRRFLSLTGGEIKVLPDPATHRTSAPASFRVLTYNILSEIYAVHKRYEYVPTWALAWSYRRHNLLREIERYNADILCLQEVQEDHFNAHLDPTLKRMGYVGVYKAKTRESMGRKGKIDGCATLWRKDLFTLREEHHIEYNSSAREQYSAAKASAGERAALTRLLKGNVGTLALLEFVNNPQQTLLVANTHIFWDPEQSEVKMHQVDVFLEELEAFLNRVGRNTPLVIGGDFNSEPNSPVYELISTGSVSAERLDTVSDPEGILSTIRGVHSLELRSTFGNGDEAPTNFTPEFIGTLDYLWYRPDTLVPTAVLEFPTEHDLLRIDGIDWLPNTRWSSDHVALMAEFQIVGYGAR